MGAPILQLGCTIRCPHGGMASVITSNRRVRASGSFALLATDTYIVTGCPVTVGVSPHPCTTIEWKHPAQRAKVDGEPVLLQTSIGQCRAADGVVQGIALVTGVQTRVKGL